MKLYILRNQGQFCGCVKIGSNGRAITPNELSELNSEGITLGEVLCPETVSEKNIKVISES